MILGMTFHFQCMRLLAFPFQVKTQQSSSDMKHTDPTVDLFMGEVQFLSGIAKEMRLLILDDHIKIFFAVRFSSVIFSLQTAFLRRLIG